MTKAVLTPNRASWLVACALLVPASALGLQPLPEFIASARSRNVDMAEATANLDGSQAQAQVSIGKVLPNASGRGVYTRSEYQVAFPLGAPFIPGLPPGQTVPVFLQRYNQYDAFFTLGVPIIDFGNYERIRAARSTAEASAQVLEATRLQVSSVVSQLYYRLVGSQALVRASEKALDIAKRNLQLSQARYEAGKGAVLEVDRAVAAVEAQSQALTQSQLSLALAIRAVQSATFMTPDMTSTVSLADELQEEGSLESFERPDQDLPPVAAAILARMSSEQQATAQRFALLPSLSGNFTDHGTNSPGFIGHEWAYLATFTLNWYLDYTTFASIRAQDAAAAAARAREERARLQTRDAIHQAWETVHASIARSRSSRSQQKAASHASQLAQDRYEAGAATQLDLLQAQKDAFDADVARISADADLAFSRLQLRLAAGIDPFAPKGTP
jgi:outer membrane protein TolC